MPSDASVKKLLIKFELSLKDAKRELEGFKRDLKTMNAESVRQAQAKSVRSKQELRDNQQKIADEKRLQAEARTLLSLDQAKAGWQKQLQEAVKTRIQQTVLETAEKKRQQVEETNLLQLAKQRIQLAQQQLKLQQQQTALANKQNQAGGGGGMFSGIIGGAGKAVAGALGGGPIGMIAAGAGIGEVAAHAFESLVEKVREFSQEIVHATGVEQQLAEQFTKLSQRAGLDPTKLINSLRAATRGLVDDLQLYRVANNFMQSGVKASGDQITRLTELTVALARAQGRDATEAMNSLVSASLTGRTMGLAMATGLDRQALALKNVSSHMDENTRKTLEFNSVLAAMEKRFKETGTPATTFVELIKQVGLIERNVLQDIGQGVASTLGFQNGIEGLSKWLIKIMPQIYAVAGAIGSGIGGAIQKLIPLAQAAWGFVQSLSQAFVSLHFAIKSLLNADPLLRKFFAMLGGENSLHLSFFEAELVGLITVIELLANALRMASINLTLWGKAVKGIGHGSLSEVKQAFKEAEAQLDASNKQFDDNVSRAVGLVTAPVGSTTPTVAGPKSSGGGDNAQLKQALAKLDVEISKEKDKQILESTLYRIDQEKKAIQDQYNDGLIKLTDYTDKEKALINERMQAELTRIEADRKVQLGELSEQRAKQVPEPEIKKQAELINVKAEGERVKAKQDADKQIEALQDNLDQDLRQAKIAYEQDQQKLTKESIQQQAKLLEQQFKQGQVSADEYLSQRKLILASERDIQIQSARDTYEVSKKNEVDLQKMRMADLEAEVNYEHQITDLVENEGQVRLAALNRKFSTMQGLIQSQLQLDQTKGVGFAPNATEDTRQLVALVTAQIGDLVSEQNRLEQAGKRYTDDWYKLHTQINGAREQLIKMNQELIKSKSISAAFGAVFDTINQKLGKILPGGVGDVLGSVAESLEGMEKDREQRAAGGDTPTGAFGTSVKQLFGGGEKSVLTPLIDASGEVVDEFSEIKKLSLSERLGGFAKGLTGLVGSIGDFAKSIFGAKSTGGGILSGAMGGLKFGSQFGPMGAVVGAAVGAAFGGIIGHKSAQVHKDVEMINTRIKAITEEMHAGAVTLGDGIKQLQQERSKALSMLGGSKKGQKQLPAILEALNTQINQLLAQQKQTLKNLHMQVEELSQPESFQPLMQQLDDIIKKYQEFASAAAGNAAEVANANQYLVLSLQQYAKTMTNEVRGAEEEAIQNALTLIDLQKQRTQLLADEAKQEYDVMTQGVTTRQRTTAMTKGEQIAQLRYQRDQQLLHMDEEIKLAKFKFDNEQKIFGLRSTAVDLETQLLALQETDATKKDADIQALMQAISKIEAATAGGVAGLPPGLLAPTGGVDPGQLAQLLGLRPIPMPGGVLPGGGSTPHLKDVPSIYENMFQALDDAGFNFTNRMTTAAATPFHSAQRLALWTELSAAGSPEAKLLAQLGLVPHHGSNWDWLDLPNWMQNQATVASYQKGGLIDKSGRANVHAGEIMLTSPVVQTLAKLAQGRPNNIWNGDARAGAHMVSETRLPVEQHIHDLTAARSAMELNVISKRHQQLAAESQHINNLRDLIRLMDSSGNFGGVNSLEGALQKIAELRGRYGAGSFTRQQI